MRSQQLTMAGFASLRAHIKSLPGLREALPLTFVRPNAVILPGMQRHAELLELHSNLRC